MKVAVRSARSFRGGREDDYDRSYFVSHINYNIHVALQHRLSTFACVAVLVVLLVVNTLTQFPLVTINKRVCIFVSLARAALRRDHARQRIFES